MSFSRQHITHVLLDHSLRAAGPSGSVTAEETVLCEIAEQLLREVKAYEEGRCVTTPKSLQHAQLMHILSEGYLKGKFPTVLPTPTPP